MRDQEIPLSPGVSAGPDWHPGRVVKGGREGRKLARLQALWGTDAPVLGARPGSPPTPVFRCEYLVSTEECISLFRLLSQNTTVWWLKQQALTFSQFWELEVQDQGIANLMRAFFLASKQPFLTWPGDLMSLPLLIRIPVVSDEGPGFMSSLDLNYIPQSPFINYNHFGSQSFNI